MNYIPIRDRVILEIEDERYKETASGITVVQQYGGVTGIAFEEGTVIAVGPGTQQEPRPEKLVVGAKVAYSKHLNGFIKYDKENKKAIVMGFSDIVAILD